MAPKTSTSRTTMSVAQIHTSWSVTALQSFLSEWRILPEWNPVCPGPTDVAFPLKPGKITLYAEFFKFCHFQLPVTQFMVELLSYYKVNISQLHPLGLIKVKHFEFCARGLGMSPQLDVFRVFYILVYKGEYFTFDRRLGA